jgi:hypothetical protein
VRGKRLASDDPKMRALEGILCLLPRWSEHRLLDLAPFYWNKTRAIDDVQVLLDANPFRRLTLDMRGGCPGDL